MEKKLDQLEVEEYCKKCDHNEEGNCYFIKTNDNILKDMLKRDRTCSAFKPLSTWTFC